MKKRGEKYVVFKETCESGVKLRMIETCHETHYLYQRKDFVFYNLRE